MAFRPGGFSLIAVIGVLFAATSEKGLAVGLVCVIIALVAGLKRY